MKYAILTIVATAALFVHGEPVTEECSSWDDEIANIRFPERIADLRMIQRSVFSTNDYSLFYVDDAWLRKEPAQSMLSVFLFSRDGVNLVEDGVGDSVRKELKDAAEAVYIREERGDFKNVKIENSDEIIKLAKNGLECVCAKLKYQSNDSNVDFVGRILVTAYMGRFLKLRCTVPVNGDDDGSEKWRAIISQIDDMIKTARTGRAVDVYAIHDPKERLAALERKWAGAGCRVSMWKMPSLAERFFEIDRFQDWCSENKQERYPQFEDACREALSLKIEPAIWYYNLACSQAVQGKKDEAIESLEKAVAAGYRNEVTAIEDSDLSSIVDDDRFKKLCQAMSERTGPTWNQPQKKIDGDANPFPRLTDDNVFYGFNDESYMCELVTTNDKAIVYINHHQNHPDVPAECLICPIFPKAAREAGVDTGAANIHFGGYPVIVASDWSSGDDKLENVSSVPALLAMERGRALLESKYVYCLNVLGIYSAGSDYGEDGIDRFQAYFPGCIAHQGDADESDKFVRLAVEALRAMPTEVVRAHAARQLLNLIRRGQRCVKCEEDFMSGIAQRPVLKFADIDCDKVIAMASKISEDDLQPDPALIMTDESSSDCVQTKVNDIFRNSFDDLVIADSPQHFGMTMRFGQNAARYIFKTFPQKEGEVVWKVLQGDPAKVHISTVDGDPDARRIEFNWQPVFDVDLPDGTKLKSSRVDVGIFHVVNGKASTPSIISMYMMPNEMREYDKDGTLVSIDYSKRQLDDYCPSSCPKGDWKDVFKWDDDGEIMGWTRYTPESNGKVHTNEYSRSGLRIISKDSLGRPVDVMKDMTATWKQSLHPTNLVAGNEAAIAQLGWLGSQYDRCGMHAYDTTLAWQYKYKDDNDRFGEPAPKLPVAFKYQPELCRRCEMTEESGFRLPLIDQMEIGYYEYAGYKHNTIDENIYDLTREDSELALSEYGIKPPAVLKKMKFNPWKPSSNDVWKVDLLEREKLWHESLSQLADGVYRWRMPPKDKESAEYDGFWYQSVSDTYRMINAFLEMDASVALDKQYKRCAFEDAKGVLKDWIDADGWERVFYVEGKYSECGDIPEKYESTFAMWKIRENLYFTMQGQRRGSKGSCDYGFIKLEDGTGSGVNLGVFRELPSAAIGNTVIGTDDRDPEAMNNMAVLLYEGIANHHHYDDETVLMLLEQAAKLGNAAAIYNLGVFEENHGNKTEALKRYDEYRVKCKSAK